MKTLSVEHILLHSYYQGSRGHGEIREVIRRDDIWAGSNAVAYAVRVRPQFDEGVVIPDFWATLSVRGVN